MHRIYKIARREFLETIKTKAFILSVILTPVFIIGIAFVNTRIEKSMRSGPKPARQIAVIDLSGQVGAEITESFRKFNTANPQRTITLAKTESTPAQPGQQLEKFKGEVRSGRLDGLLVVAADRAGQPARAASQYFTKIKNLNDMDTYGAVQRLLNEAVMVHRYRQHNLSPALIAELNRPVALDQVDIEARKGASSTTGRSQAARIMIPFFFMFLMFMGIVGISQGMLTSVIEEKNSRVVEVLLAAVSPLELMAGKILGLSAVGLSLIALWGLASAGAAAWFGLTGLFTPGLLAWFIVYYVLGFLVTASLFAAVGAACNSLKEAQALMTPLMMIVVLPMIVWLPIAQNPNGTLALVFSFIPTAAPMVMIVRLCASPDLPLVQIFGSLAVLIFSMVAVVWAASKVFRTGILMYGKPPTLREMLRWVRAH